MLAIIIALGHSLHVFLSFLLTSLPPSLRSRKVSRWLTFLAPTWHCREPGGPLNCDLDSDCEALGSHAAAVGPVFMNLKASPKSFPTSVLFHQFYLTNLLVSCRLWVFQGYKNKGEESGRVCLPLLGVGVTGSFLSQSIQRISGASSSTYHNLRRGFISEKLKLLLGGRGAVFQSSWLILS